MDKNIEKSQHDGFAVIDKVNQRYFSEIEHSVPHFQQTLFDLQNECYKSWKNILYVSTFTPKINRITPQDLRSTLFILGL